MDVWDENPRGESGSEAAQDWGSPCSETEVGEDVAWWADRADGGGALSSAAALAYLEGERAEEWWDDGDDGA